MEILNGINYKGTDYVFSSDVRTPVILDTDFGGDIDDVNALATLCWGERMGLVDIIGVVATVPRFGEYNSNTYDVVSAMDAVCNYFGLSDIAFGINKEVFAKTSAYCATACTYPHTIDSSEAYDAPEFYRRALSSLPSGVKCKVAIVGYLTAFSRFLDSPADAISSKTGLQLALEKIDTLYIMGGRYPNGMVETNLADGGKAYMVNASNNVMTNFTNRIIWLGAEQADIHMGHILYDEGMNWSILYNCMYEFMSRNFATKQAAGTLPSGVTDVESYWKHYDYAWDPETVLAMIDANIDITGYNLVQGDASIITTEGTDYGKNVFTANNTGNDYYVSKKTNRTTTWFSKRLDSIIEEKNWLSHYGGFFRLARKAGTKTTRTFDISVIPTSSSSTYLNLPYTAHKDAVLYISIDNDPPIADGSTDAIVNIYQSTDVTATFAQFTASKHQRVCGGIIWNDITQLRGYFYSKKNVEYVFHCTLIEFTETN